MSFIKNVTNALIDSNLSQSDICKGANITNATLSNALNKPLRKPTFKTVEKVKRFLELKGMNWID